MKLSGSTITVAAPVFAVDQLLADPCASYWLKDRLRELAKRDPIDMADDCETLLRYAFAAVDAAAGATGVTAPAQGPDARDALRAIVDAADSGEMVVIMTPATRARFQDARDALAVVR